MNKLNINNRAVHYINGQWLEGYGESFVSKNPADNSIVWQGNKAISEETLLAAEAAHLALPAWSISDFATRAHYLKNFAQEIEKRRQELAYLIALETGKPLWESQTEVSAVVGKIHLSIKAYQERNAEKRETLKEATTSLRYQPLGVVAVLGPFNFPAHLPNGHIVPALIAGNTVVYKPSELTPLVAQFIMQCWHETGIPPGVINCLQGDSVSARALLSTDLQGVFFTGSYATGQKIHQQFSDRPEVLLALEMGGNNPLIVDHLSDVNAAVYQTILSAFISAGQRCTCARRLFIPADSFGDKFLAQFVNATADIKIGRFNEKSQPFMGPLISEEHAKMHLNAQRNLVNTGGESLLTMRSLTENSGFVSAGIIDMTKVPKSSDEEIFAPLVQIYRYQDFEEAVFSANQTRYGLTAGLLSEKRQHYDYFASTIRAGLINWNRPTTGALSSLPFGGIGLSGNHRPSAYFAADYCSYPIASLEQPILATPAELLPGIAL